MNENLSFGFIGGGRVTYFLLKALKQKNALPKKVIIADPNEAVREKVQEFSPDRIQGVSDNKHAAQADIVFLAVHPPIIKDVIDGIKAAIKKKAIFISLAPVVKIEKLSALLGGFDRLVRMIPNAPSIIHQGYNPVVFGKGIKVDEKSALINLFKHWGEAPEVDEDKLEVYAIVTAMGPTYFWPQWLKLQQLGLEFGMTEAELKAAMPAMLTSAVNILYQSGMTAEEVMDLIPVYPLKEEENTIKDIFHTKLTGLYQKLTKK